MLDNIKEEKVDVGQLEDINGDCGKHIKLEPTESQPCTSSSLANKKCKTEAVTKHEPVVHEQCPICLSLMKHQLLARPVECKHNFCLECIEEWSKVSLFIYRSLLNGRIIIHMS